jgi:F0F1-type ATP synthase assembly protein I
MLVLLLIGFAVAFFWIQSRAQKLGTWWNDVFNNTMKGQGV